jgi:hypothetical protein
MKKKDVIYVLENAERYHKEQLEKVARLLQGKKEKKLTPLNKEACEFGKWLYGEGRVIETMLGLQFYDNIELMHAFWHNEYAKIYNLLFDTQKNRIVSFFLGNKKHLSATTMQEVQHHFQELQEITKNLLKALSVAKKRILALLDENLL